MKIHVFCLCQEVDHHLHGVLPWGIADGLTEGGVDDDVDGGLLADLADGGLDLGLSRLDVPLGERPMPAVDVTDQQDLHGHSPLSSCGRPQGLYAARNEKIPVEVDFTIDSDIPEDQNSEEFRKFAENLEKNANDLADLVIRMPRDYPASLRSVLERRNVSQQALADRMHMQASEVYKLLKADQEAPGPTLKQLVRACLALRLDYDESVQLIESAGKNLRANKEDVNIYRLMLKSTKILDLETCNNALMALHMKPFFDPVNG